MSGGALEACLVVVSMAYARGARGATRPTNFCLYDAPHQFLSLRRALRTFGLYDGAPPFGLLRPRATFWSLRSRANFCVSASAYQFWSRRATCQFLARRAAYQF